ncbi:MAG: Ig-like domain-containing protein [Clostridia bacterium]|nr:Ig-like domain-containing protein [Clostridia bacterium]
MRLGKLLCLLLAITLALSGVAALAEEAAPLEAVVEEVEAVLGEEAPEAASETAPEGDLQPQTMEAPEDAAPTDTDGTAPDEQAVAAPAGPLTALSLPAEMTIGVGEQAQLRPVPTPAGATYSLTYATGKKKIVPVTADGVITGKKKGTATITATADNGVSAQVKVTVLKGPKTVTLTAPAAVGLGDRFRCGVVYNAKAGGGYALTSDNPAVLRVESDGSVSALALGAATLTARSYNGKESSAAVKVLAAPTAMWLSQTEATVGQGGTLKLAANFPEGSGGTVSYASSNAGVASVDPATGEVTGAALGSAVITARSYNGLTDACAVRVLPAPEGLTVPASSIALGVGEQAQLAVAPQPAGSACSLTYKSGKPKYVTVSADGVVTAHKKGKAVVTVKAQNGVSVKVKVQVLAAPKTVSIQVDRPTLAVGETTMARCVLPKKTAAGYTFRADDSGVLRIAADGTITALAEGVANVYVTTSNGLTASAAVTVGTPAAPSAGGATSGPFEITFMNIGRNDGILIHCGGEWAYIDSGSHQQGPIAVDYMRAQGVNRLKYYIGTHGHIDHVGGAPVILAAIPTEQVIVPHDRVTSQIKKLAQSDAEKQAASAANYRVVTVGDKFWLGGAEFLVLGPIKIVRCDPKKNKENYNSLVIRVTYGNNTFLLTGDATNKEFKEIEAANPGCLRAQVYKVPHHNSTFAFPAQRCQPQISVFSTSRNDLPKSKFVKFLRELGSEIYITADNRHGHVKIVSDGKTLSVTTQYPYQ